MLADNAVFRVLAGPNASITVTNYPQPRNITEKAKDQLMEYVWSRGTSCPARAHDLDLAQMGLVALVSAEDRGGRFSDQNVAVIALGKSCGQVVCTSPLPWGWWWDQAKAGWLEVCGVPGGLFVQGACPTEPCFGYEAFASVDSTRSMVKACCPHVASVSVCQAVPVLTSPAALPQGPDRVCHCNQPTVRHGLTCQHLCPPAGQ